MPRHTRRNSSMKKYDDRRDPRANDGMKSQDDRMDDRETRHGRSSNDNGGGWRKTAERPSNRRRGH